MDLKELDVICDELEIIELRLDKIGKIWAAKAVINGTNKPKNFYEETESTIGKAIGSLVGQITNWKAKSVLK